MTPVIQLKKTFPLFIVSIVFARLAFPSIALAVSPTPDGLYSGANVAEGGAGALMSLTTGTNNTALGSEALKSLTTGKQNTATGAQALKVNTGNENTADGFQALNNNTTGFLNTATGWRALFQNASGVANTALGSAALYNNTASGNTAVGSEALRNNITGQDNTAVGISALASNNPDPDFVGTGDDNTAVGSVALANNRDGYENTGIGSNALFANIHGHSNTAVGNDALSSNRGSELTGHDNTAVGDGALADATTGNGNVAVGSDTGKFVTVGTFNTFVGTGAGRNITNASSVICIGDDVDGANVSHSCYIGNINGQPAIGGEQVFITTDGKLGTLNVASAARFKDDIKPMDKASEAILALQPVTFRYKKEFDPKAIPQFGLVAEDVVKVNPDLVKRDRDGKLQTVRYEAVNAMLLNEFLKEHRTVQELKKEVAALTAGLQKVTAQLELSKPAAQTVANKQ